MTNEETKAIGDFFAAAEKLRELNIIRSDKYLGDISEFICKSELGVVLTVSGRQPGYDGKIEGSLVQLKFNGGTSTTIDCGNPDDYDEILVVLGPNSVLRPDDASGDYLIYRIPKHIVQQKSLHSDGKRRYSKGQIPQIYLCATKSWRQTRA